MFLLKHMGKQDIFERVEATIWIYKTLISLLGAKFCGLAYLCFGFFFLEFESGNGKNEKNTGRKTLLKEKVIFCMMGFFTVVLKFLCQKG